MLGSISSASRAFGKRLGQVRVRSSTFLAGGGLAAMRIAVVDLPDHARFELRIEGEVVGCASYHVADGVAALPHTEVDPTRHGRGLGTILVQGVLAAVRERRLLVRPYCPFVRHYLLTHPGELDLVSAGDRPLFGLPPEPPALG